MPISCRLTDHGMVRYGTKVAMAHLSGRSGPVEWLNDWRALRIFGLEISEVVKTLSTGKKSCWRLSVFCGCMFVW